MLWTCGGPEKSLSLNNNKPTPELERLNLAWIDNSIVHISFSLCWCYIYTKNGPTRDDCFGRDISSGFGQRNYQVSTKVETTYIKFLKMYAFLEHFFWLILGAYSIITNIIHIICIYNWRFCMTTCTIHSCIL